MWGGTGVGESFTRAFEIGCHLDRGDLAAARRVADAALTGRAGGEGGRLMMRRSQACWSSSAGFADSR